jgi:glycosyltransferase involved in cell wall biosynthesis
VVFVGHVARLSGGEIALLRLVSAMTEHVDAHVILGEDGPLVGRLREQGASVEVLAMDPLVRDIRKDTVTATGLSLRSLPALIGYIWRLRQRLRELRPDVVHTNTLKAALYGGVAARLARRRVVWHIRDRIADDYLPHSAVRLVRALSRVIPTAIVVNSQSTLETLPAKARALVLYNPIVPDSVERPQLGGMRGTTQLTIGVLGRLAPWKGQHVFLEAFAHEFMGEPVKAHIIGSAMFGEDAYAAGLVDQAERLDISGQVEFRGFCDDVWAELDELDILVHCSITPEPFGQVVLEGMAAGLPVVAAGIGGPAEVIKDEVDGLLVDPSDPTLLAATLRRLADDPELRARLGKAALESARAYSPERTAATLLNVYEEVLGRR